jgi:hypothetical protein
MCTQMLYTAPCFWGLSSCVVDGTCWLVILGTSVVSMRTSVAECCLFRVGSLFLSNSLILWQSAALANQANGWGGRHVQVFRVLEGWG